MYCVPACKGCREAGSCPRGELPASAFTPPKRRPAPRRAAVKTTYPRERVTYARLQCGHVTDSTAQLFYSVWQPRDGEGVPQLFCERCGTWVNVSLVADHENKYQQEIPF